MDLRQVIRVAVLALTRNKLRTLLTMLGIIIGVGAVICTVAIGQGAGEQVQAQIQGLGENMIFVQAGSVNANGVRLGSEATKTLTVSDARAILQQIPSVAMVSPGVSAAVQVVNGSLNWFTRVTGASAEYFQIRRWPLDHGSIFTRRDVETSANVLVMGQTVANQLFRNQDPVGQIVRVQNIPFRVLGVLSRKGQSTFGQDQDDTMIMPYTTVQKKIVGINWLQYIMVSCYTQAEIPHTEAAISSLLRQRHRLRTKEENDFIIRSPMELAQASQKMTNILTLLLGGVASVSLLVGGIGIMNIMLVSVTERTREIGVRMAVGATEKDVQLQFLSEALVLSLLGGAIGIAGGTLISVLLARLLGWPPTISLTAIIVAAVFSMAVGVFFGYYPARKAAHLDPIQALRYE